MPIFNYKCPNCGAEEEIICNFNNRPEVIKCTCRGDGVLPTLMRRVFTFGNFKVNGYNERNGYSNAKEE